MSIMPVSPAGGTSSRTATASEARGSAAVRRRGLPDHRCRADPLCDLLRSPVTTRRPVLPSLGTGRRVVYASRTTKDPPPHSGERHAARGQRKTGRETVPQGLTHLSPSGCGTPLPLDVGVKHMASPGTFVVVPLWLIDLDVSGAALKIYCALAAFGTYDGDRYHGCRPSVATLAARIKMSPRTVQRALAELVSVGAVEREKRVTATGGTAPSVYLLAVEGVKNVTPSDLHRDTDVTRGGVTDDVGGVSRMADNLEPDTQIEPAPTVRAAREPRPTPAALFDPPPAVVADAPEPNLTETQKIIGEWLERCRERPPGRIIGRVSKIVKDLLAEGVSPYSVRRGIALWMNKSIDPSTLHSFVNQAQNAGTGDTPPSRARQRHDNNRKVVEMFRGVSGHDILPQFGPRRLTAGGTAGGMA